MRSKILRLITLTLLSLFVSSCLSLTSGLSHESSGEGRLSLEYRLNKKAIGIQRDAVNDRNLIPLPLSQRDFEEMTALVPGITLRSFSETEDLEYIYIQTELDYQSLNDLTSFLGFPVEYSSAGNIESLVLRIYDAQDALDPEAQAILDTVFANDTLKFEFTFPRNIRNSSYGRVSGRTVSYEVSLPDIYRQSGFVWLLEW